MTSINSSAKSGFSAAFRKAFRQNIISSAACAIANVIIAVAAFYSLMSTYMYDGYVKTPEKIDFTDLFMIISFASEATVMLNGFLSVRRMHKELYSKRAADFYFSTPIKRNEYFNANVLFGIASALISFVVPYVVAAVLLMMQSRVNAVYEHKTVLCLAVVLFLDISVELLSFILAAVVSGKKHHYILFSLIGMSGFSLISTSAAEKLNTIWGLKVNEALAYILNPVTSSVATAYTDISMKAFALEIVIALAEIAVLYTVAYLVFKHRKAEVAEVCPTGKIVPLVYLAIVIAAAFLNFSTMSSFWLSAVSGIAFAVLSCLLFGIIFYKKPFSKQSLITLASVCGVCIVFLAVVSFPSYDRFISYVPEAEEVESVSIIPTDYQFTTGGYTWLQLYSFGSGADKNEGVELKSAEAIDKAIALHKALTDKRTIEKTDENLNTAYDLFMESYESPNGIMDCKITYKLKNGRTVTRGYLADTTYLREAYYDLLRCDEVLDQIVCTADEENVMLLLCEYDTLFDEGNGHESIFIDSAGYSEFAEALKKDRKLEPNGTLAIAESNKLGFSDYSIYGDTSSWSMSVELNYIVSNAPQAVKEKARSLSYEERVSKYEKWQNSYMPSDLFDGYWETEYIMITDMDVNTLEFLRSKGVDIDAVAEYYSEPDTVMY